MTNIRWKTVANGSNLVYIDDAGYIYATVSIHKKCVWIWMDSLNLDFKRVTDAILYDVDNIAIAKKEIEEVFDA